MVKLNQRGVTVIELLVALTILSLIIVLIWNVFFQGLHFSKKEMTKNQMQQEANVIITHLTKIHQRSEAYEITSNSCKISATYHEVGQSNQTITFENNRLCLTAENLDEDATDKYYIAGDPNHHDTSLSILIKDINDPDVNIHVDTLLYRIGGE
ncbi:type II secretion system protein [Niallia oryzisoli]|uniref:type II secretion system protein n=1 Tax=Niallia oryzisoli TaxID=1737571 RepID=UPI0037355A3F